MATPMINYKTGKMNGKAVATALRLIDASPPHSHEGVPHHHMKQLRKLGLVDRHPLPREAGKRGRSRLSMVVSKKGRGLLAMAKNWGTA